MSTATENLEKWFLEPLELIRKASSGDSFLIELLVACVLYERYAHAKHGLSPNNKQFFKQLAKDFTLQDDFEDDGAWEVKEDAAIKFWEMVRVGLAHQGMPLQKSRDRKNIPGWFMHDSYPDRTPIRFEKTESEWILKVQPDVFVDRTIELWRQNPDLVETSKSFPFPKE